MIAETANTRPEALGAAAHPVGIRKFATLARIEYVSSRFPQRVSASDEFFLW